MADKLLVVSAVNLTEGGPLTILRECLSSAADTLGADWEIVALVHDRHLIQSPHARCLEFPDSKRSWLRRLHLEWIGFNSLSRELRADLWLSLHDITPRVKARRQVVYCHNASPFYGLSLREAFWEPKLLLFNWFYAQLYRMNIWRNYAVVVQQEWMRAEFCRRFRHPNVVVAHPVSRVVAPEPSARAIAPPKQVFLYPALPRVFKNFEVLCDAAEQLADTQPEIEIRLTLDGTENRYAGRIVRRYGHLPTLRFIGRQSLDEMASQLAQCAAVLFPSKLESWGLPITEAKALGKRVLVANLPYAHETVGSYDRVDFLPATDSRAWAEAMVGVASGNLLPAGAVCSEPMPPFAEDWSQLWKLLIKDL